MSQVNVNPGGPGYVREGSGAGTVVAVVLVLLLVAFLVWAFAFGGWNSFAAAPTGPGVSTGAPAGNSTTNINVNPGGSAPGGTSGTSGTSGGTTGSAPSGTTGGTTNTSKP